MLSTVNMHSVFKCLVVYANVSYNGWQHGTQWDMNEAIIALAFNKNYYLLPHGCTIIIWVETGLYH